VGLAVAWLSWKRYSQLTIPSIEAAAVGPVLRASPQTR
jgi:hypothetical protein